LVQFLPIVSGTIGIGVQAWWTMPDPLDVFAANLRRIRQEAGLSQERLAHSAHLHMTHVAKIERREREPGVRTVSKLARALEVCASEIFDGIDGRSAGRDVGIGPDDAG
jgi:ribosome-binding protein aMBF1 (putative translation factor)